MQADDLILISVDDRLNGKVERSHRIDNEEFYRLLEGVVIDDSALFNEKIQGCGRPSTTTIIGTEAWAARPPTNDCARGHRTRVKRDYQFPT
jgi:hypothetical protein